MNKQFLFSLLLGLFGYLTVSGQNLTGSTLHLTNASQGSDGNTIILGSTSNSNLRLGYHSNYSWIQSHGGKPLVLNAIGNNVGIGTTDPAYRLDVNGRMRASDITTGSLSLSDYIDGPLLVANEVQAAQIISLGAGRNPLSPLHVKMIKPNGYVASFENTSDSNPNGLYIKLHKQELGNTNNFITFSSGSATATNRVGRIEGYQSGSGFFNGMPGASDRDYYYNEGPAGEITNYINSIKSSVADHANNLSGSLGLGSLNQSQLDELKDAISDPGVFNMSSYLYDMTCWALDRGMESLITTNPFDLALASLIIAAADQCNDDGVTYASGAGDYAEWLPRFDESEKMSFGQIVGVTGGAITKNTEGAEQLMVVSMNPIVLGNMPPEEADEKNYEKVAFMGQVPVWIIGKVQSGDYLLPSGKNDGFAIAVSPEKITLDQVSQIVGRAWEDGENPINLVNTVVGVKTNEMAQIMKKFAQQVNEQAEKMNEVEARLGRIEAALAN